MHKDDRRVTLTLFIYFALSHSLLTVLSSFKAVYRICRPAGVVDGLLGVGGGCGWRCPGLRGACA